MWRKIAVLLIGILVLVPLWYEGAVSDYLRILWRLGRQHAEESLPLTVEIQRAEAMLARLAQTNDRLICRQAALTVSIRQLEQQLQRGRQELLRDREQLRALRERLPGDDVADSETSSNTPRTKLLAELRQRFRLYQERENLLRQREQLLAEQQRLLQSLVEQRRQLQAEQAELTARIQKLQTQWELVQLAESAATATGNGNSPATDLAELRSLLDRLERRLEISQLEQQLRRESLAPTLPLEHAADLLDAVDRHLGASP